MAMPIVCVALISVCWLVIQSILGQRRRLPFSLFLVWMALLGVAWVLKLTGDPMYW
jgi:hypothetical protein